jgi:hypothetical protein
VIENVLRNTSLNRRRLEKPDARATSMTRRRRSWSSSTARCIRLAVITACGGAPTCFRNSRRRCRSLNPRRTLSCFADVALADPTAIILTARETTRDVSGHVTIGDGASGRQRRQARKPAASAADGAAKKIRLRGFGKGAGHDGRQ